MIMFDLLFISFIIVFITDCTDFPNSVKYTISKWLTDGKSGRTDYRLHLIDCSLCQTFWVCNIYMLCTHTLTLPNEAYVCFLALFSSVYGNIFLLVKELCDTLISIIRGKL